MSIERRQHERYELLAHVELSHGGRVETLAAINISAGGVLLLNDRNDSSKISRSYSGRIRRPG